MKEVLIVLDSFEYKKQEENLKQRLEEKNTYVFEYTRYENSLTEIFQKMKFMGSFMTHVSYWLMSFFYSVKFFVKYRRNKNIVFINPIVGIFYSALSRLFFQNQNLTISGFLFEEKSNKLYWILRKMFVNFCYKKVTNIIVYGDAEVDYYSSVFPALASNFKFVEYGRDFSYSDKKNFDFSGDYIASGGRSNRNYQTLCDAFDMVNEKLPELNCLVATRHECVVESMSKSKIKFIYGVTLNQFGSFVENSELFVLPLLNTNLSAGHMSMMEAMSVGKVVLVTDIPSIRNYVNESEVFFYEPDNPKTLANQIIYIYQNRNSDEVKNKIVESKKLYLQKYSFDALLERIINISLT